MRSTKERASEVLRRLKARYRKEMHTSLEHSNPWELLVATILSAQSQDRQVNKITRRLFKKYRKIEDYSVLRPRELYPYVRSIGLYRGKAARIVNSARLLKEDFGSKVPRTMEELVTLPGVGRKTANVVLSDAFGINTGIAIDTHCVTVSNRLGFVRTRNPVKIERRLMGLLPNSEWKNVNHMFIALGRDTCTARAKYCRRCTLNDICPSSDAR
jgi:endonuclease-3